ncbi:MAG: (Fe-S)-binding protein [Desulfurococcaceae archaeon]|nr:(Fe-S)-binding protein [Desulfurococcaceae archaeon]
MSSKDLTSKLSEYIESCKKCGFCKAVCPVLKVSDHIETYGPRGRILLLQGLYEGLLKPREYLARRLYCTLCGYCSIKCISGLELTEAYLIGRTLLTENGIVLDVIGNLIKSIVSTDNPYNVDPSIKAMWIDYLPEKPPTKGRVVYWAGCTTSIRRPDSALAAYELIKSLVGDVAVIDSEPCCGWPLYLAGDVVGYRSQVSKALRSLEGCGAGVVITTCPACTRSLRDKARELGIKSSIKVYHIVEWLYELMKEGKLPKLQLEETITYHDPCELSRHMKVFKEPREIIRSIQGLKLVEMRGNQLESNCCGGGGLYLALDADKSSNIALNRLNDVPNGVKVLVTACPSCEVQLNTAVRGKGLELEVLDISELILRSLNK